MSWTTTALSLSLLLPPCPTSSSLLVTRPLPLYPSFALTFSHTLSHSVLLALSFSACPFLAQTFPLHHLPCKQGHQGGGGGGSGGSSSGGGGSGGGGGSSGGGGSFNAVAHAIVGSYTKISEALNRTKQQAQAARQTLPPQAFDQLQVLHVCVCVCVCVCVGAVLCCAVLCCMHTVVCLWGDLPCASALAL